MELRTVESLEALRALREPVAALEHRLPEATPYLTHRWVTAFWAAFGEALEGRALCAFEGGRLLAWLPLAWPRGLRGRLPPRQVRPMGGRWGIFSLPCDPGRPDAAAALLGGLRRPAWPGWEVLQLGPLRGGADELGAWRAALGAQGLPVESTAGRNPFLRLDGGYAAFLGRRSQNFRKNARKRLEAVEQDATFTLRHEVDPGWPRLRDSVVAVSGGSWQGSAGVAVGASAGGRAFYQALSAPDPSFQVHLTTIEREGRCVAYLVGLRRGGVYHAFDTGFDPAHRQCSPGLVIHLAALRALCEAGVGEADLGFDAGYKDRFDPEYRAFHDLRIFSGPLPRSLWRLRRAARRLVQGHPSGASAAGGGAAEA